ncbi:MAG: hypothetical protein COW24_03435 [Candidatus Kerfeldbacteria bacterium CG15_BIG_FIL_POST_REV_8_21_14_020_45_12]|uniref:Uncharacterized protein n=1 Tax=Candidatus Kerfeldbacteria bacterium CG15_BIG_FIL_POST_REV_8_21_14_020_45_12 TaxID=2014247 RepID=A0A2M7H3K1_9BACT|nr:MAG: hypothetical protein COW24_03435 [Candidatus Kerfeldbacteria bacterium CG15_BIG_FIL_POST_REV_8_21_14_020_45_12]PJA93083.1 MAG: hypothetical protein CO132_05020 [Candidatus Kerfeldbacteria bacterium CG_4_9_14_3_um_filter_45_8]
MSKETTLRKLGELPVKKGGRASFESSLKQGASTPNLEGLSETFEVQVGDHRVTCAWILRDYFLRNPSTQEVIDEVVRRQLRCPSRAIAIAAFQAKKVEMDENPSVAIDGVVQTDADGYQFVGYVGGRRAGRSVGRDDLRHVWIGRYRFLVVVSE